MIYLNFKRVITNKWNMVKLFIISPIHLFLPILFISKSIDIKLDSSLALKISLWSAFYFTIFEIVFNRIEVFSTEKINDILISKTSLFRYNLYHTISINLLYLPTLIFTLVVYNYFFNLNIEFLWALLLTLLVFFNNIIFSYITLAIHLKNKNYFNKFNFFIEFLYIITGVIYPITALPFILRKLSTIFPINYIFRIADGYNFTLSIITGFLIYILLFVISILLMNRSIKKYKNEGGFYG